MDAYVASRHFNFSNGRKVRLSFESDNAYLKQYLTETPFNSSQKMHDGEKGHFALEVVLDDTTLIDAWIAAWGSECFQNLKKTDLAKS